MDGLVELRETPNQFRHDWKDKTLHLKPAKNHFEIQFALKMSTKAATVYQEPIRTIIWLYYPE